MIDLPGNKGGAMWSPPAYSPQTKYFYTMGVNEAHDFIAQPPAARGLQARHADHRPVQRRQHGD